jgi:sugar diacid utilization regulator
MSSELQALVDELARRLDRPTVLEDPQQRMIVHSSHSEPIDEVRRDSILRRAATPEVIAWFRQFGISQAQHPVRIPPDPVQGIRARLCVPVRFRDQLMGHLWLIDENDELGPEDVETVERHAETVGLVLYQEWMAQRFASDVLLNLLSSSDELRETAARDILDSGMFPTGRPCVVVVVVPVPTADSPENLATEINQGLWEAGRELANRATLRLARSDHGVLLLPTNEADASETQASVHDAASKVRSAVARFACDSGCVRTLAAIGDPQPRLTLAAQSYRHARLTAHVATAIPSLGDLPEWRDLGVFRALALLPSDELVDSIIDPRLRRLLEQGGPRAIETMEAYLDLGCDAKETAEKLHLHRATLYYRLHKIEENFGIDLRSGSERLTVHLGLKLARLAGVHPLPAHQPTA